MRRTILEIYAMAICFVSVLFFVGFLCSSAYHALEYAMPLELMDGFQYNRFLTNEGFCQATYGVCNQPASSVEAGIANINKPAIRLSEEVITKKREDHLAAAIAGIKHNCFISLIWALICMPITAVIFLIHWKIGRKAREANA